MEQIRVLVIDDHPVVRRGLQSLLSQYPYIEIVGAEEGGPAALELIASMRPDVILLDVRLAGFSGLELARQLRRMPVESRIIILTSYEDEAYLLEAAQAGVHGYLLKSSSAEVLAEAIRAVYTGERQLSAELAGKALQHLQTLSQSQVQSETGLSEQELQLLQLMASGATTHDMSQTLFFSERTVKRKIQDVLSKLGAASRAQAVAEAFKRGLL
ncbi:MAG: response regulator transcription factor [Ardenticatenaceae bacterium]|nr:response regulator transcription factor [Ardenticatenaceae bacterium]HBY98343.1 DNA-binding response regulator [Chloroflexota bacterium]